MNHRRPARWLALLLTLTLTLAPAAQAISVEEARQLLQENYIDPIPDAILNLPTITEITDALGDPYTYYMSAEEYQSFETSLNDTNVTGIGAMVLMAANGLEVSAVAPDSPASKGGLKAGDLIVGVDGASLESFGSSEVMSHKIPGDVGTKVTLTVLRDEKTFELALTRAAVVFPTVIGELVDGHIGWLDCTSFGETTGAYFEEYITKEDKDADRWVVDLRGNPGGYAGAVIEAVGHVLGNRDVSYILNNQDSIGIWRPNPFPVEIPGLIQEPLIVMTDNSSASASELFAAAVRDYGYALLIGTRTFGKGIAQNVFPQEDGSVFKITTDRYYSPNWVTPDHTGVLPHLVVDPGLAPAVATLLSGKTEEKASPDVLVLKLAGETWYVHKDETTAKDGKAALSALLEALAPNTPMTLNGKSVTPAEVSTAWQAEYTSRAFADLAGSPNADAINTLAALDVLSGDEDGNFNPSGQLTRAELCSLLTQAMGYWSWKSQGRPPFADVEEGVWYDTPVTIMYNLGLVQGDADGNFNPDGLVDHQQFLTILGRAAAQTDLTLKDELSAELPAEALSRSGLAQYADWAQPAAYLAEAHEFLSAPLEQLAPSGITTREEAAVMVHHMMKYIGILSSVTDEPAA